MEHFKHESLISSEISLFQEIISENVYFRTLCLVEHPYICLSNYELYQKKGLIIGNSIIPNTGNNLGKQTFHPTIHAPITGVFPDMRALTKAGYLTRNTKYAIMIFMQLAPQYLILASQFPVTMIILGYVSCEAVSCLTADCLVSHITPCCVPVYCDLCLILDCLVSNITLSHVSY